MRIKSTLLWVTLATSSMTQAKLIVKPWDEFNDPNKISRDFEYVLDELPLTGDIHTQENPKGWSGSYWPDNRGSIALRSSQNNHRLLKIEGLESEDNKFNYQSPGLDQLKEMSENDLKLLSPAEKLDILAGRYNYPLRAEVYTRASKKDPNWEGICHGWSPASLNHSEPNPVTLTNADGIKVPFGSSDIKGLLSYFYAYHAPEPAINVAIRCNSRFLLFGGKACQGINAGSFHILLSNLVGIRKDGMVVDITRGAQVWNQPVVSYKTRFSSKVHPVKKKQEDDGIVKQVEVLTTIKYLFESKQNWKPVPRNLRAATFRYILELDASGKIVGGEWLSTNRPDFAWVLRKQSFDSHPLFQQLTDVFEASTKP